MRAPRLWGGLAWMLAVTLASAQEVVFDEGRDVVTLPLVMVSNGNVPGLPCVEVALAEDRRALMMLDTGAGLNAIDPKTAKAIGLEQRGWDFSLGVTGNARVPLYRSNDLEFGGAFYEAPLVHGMAASRFSVLREQQIEGILGVPFFARCVVTIDYARGQVEMRDLESFEPPVGALELEVSYGLGPPEVLASIDGGDAVRYVVDTGAEPALILYGAFVERHGFAAEQPGSLPTQQLSGFHSAAGASMGSLARFSLSSGERAIRVIENVPAILMPAADGVSLGGDKRCAGIIGSGFFFGTRVTFDYAGHRIFVEPADALVACQQPTGLMFGKDDDGVDIRWVAEFPGRPEVDLRVSDRVLAVSGIEPPPSLERIHALLLEQPETLLTIERDGERKDVAWPRIDSWPRVRAR